MLLLLLLLLELAMATLLLFLLLDTAMLLPTPAILSMVIDFAKFYPLAVPNTELCYIR